LQTHPITRPHLTAINRIGMLEPRFGLLSERRPTPLDGGPLARR
jgi:hypothetical protein